MVFIKTCSVLVGFLRKAQAFHSVFMQTPLIKPPIVFVEFFL